MLSTDVRPRTPTSSRAQAGTLGCKASPLSPPPRVTPRMMAKAVASPTLSNGASASDFCSKPGTPTSSRPASFRMNAPSPVAVVSALTAATPRDVVPGSPKVATAPKIPLLRLAAANNSEPRRAVKDSALQVALYNTKKPVKTGIQTKMQPPSTIFKPLEPQKAPSLNAFHAKHTHSNPFDEVRQVPLPSQGKRTSIPRAESQPAAPHSTGRKVPPPDSHHVHRTDPIVQESVATQQRAVSPGMRHLAVPGTTPKSESAMRWDNPAVTPSRFGKRCSSAPAGIRESSAAATARLEGISTQSTKREPSLRGVWVPEIRPVKPVTVRAPYAATTPRAATPTPSTFRKPSIAPYASVEPSSSRAATKKPELAKPFHTTTPRGPLRSSNPSYTIRAPFHTSTPRGPAVKSSYVITNNVLC